MFLNKWKMFHPFFWNTDLMFNLQFSVLCLQSQIPFLHGVKINAFRGYEKRKLSWTKNLKFEKLNSNSNFKYHSNCDLANINKYVWNRGNLA